MPKEVAKDKVNVTKTANFKFETPVKQSLQEKHLQTHTHIPTQSERIGC